MADFYPSHSRQKHLKQINTISFGLGILGALGVRFHFNFFSGNIQKFSEIVKIAVIVYCSMVGNFQETTVSSVHFIGASLCFGLGTIYIWIQVRQLCLYCVCIVLTPWAGVPHLLPGARLLPPRHPRAPGVAGRPGLSLPAHRLPGGPGRGLGLRRGVRMRAI